MKSKPEPYHPLQNFLDAMPEVSGNTVNGLGESEVRQPSPFFWHPPNKQTHGDLQAEVIRYHRQSDAMREHFNPEPPGGRGPAPAEKADEVVSNEPSAWVASLKEFALANDGDDVRIAAMNPLYVYEGYELNDPWVILIAVTMDYEELAQAPASFENPTAGVVVAKEYNRASRACRKLANWILEQGYYAKPWPGPYASALSMMPAAIDSGLGQLGKHGSLIHRQFGSSFRLAAVTTDMPLVADTPEDFGSEDFCLNCQVCTKACPPQAISNDKQMVRGVEKWYVDFDKCIPYFGQTLACGICLAVCPWSKPGTGPRLAEKMLRRRNKTNPD
ncbi:MAG: 4Fe-4S dicluster domain-containing protein [Burkholderiaceae bacterium]